MKKNNSSVIRSGLGFDSHSFGATGTLVLGGVRFPGVPRLKGHSDGDALLHAVIDALLGAAGLGDIGDLFSDRDAKFKGIASVRLLRKVLSLLKKNKFQTVNVDVTVVAERPRLTPAKAALRRFLSKEIGVPERAVNVKAKTPEGLTLFSAPGGIAVWAIATVHSL